MYRFDPGNEDAMSLFNKGDIPAFAKATHPLVSVLLHRFVEDYEDAERDTDYGEYGHFVSGDDDYSGNGKVDSDDDHIWKEAPIRTDGPYYNKYLDCYESD